MRMFGCKLLIVFMAAVMGIFFAGCNAGRVLMTSQHESTEKKKVIGLSLYYRQDEYYRDTEAAFINEAETRGYEIIVQDADADLYRQIQQLEDFVAAKVDLILMTAVEPNKIVSTVQEINDANIPIIAYDEPPRGGKLLTSVIWDNYKAGKMIGEWTKDYIEKNYAGKANIAILDLPSQYLCMERVRGFKDVIHEMPEVRIVSQNDCKADRSYSMSVTEELIKSGENIDIILGVTDDAAFGAVAAIEAAKEDIIVVCAGSWSVEAMKALAHSSRYYKANVTVNPYEQAQIVFDVIDQYFKEGKVEEKYYMSMKVYDKDNINELNWRAIEASRNR